MLSPCFTSNSVIKWRIFMKEDFLPNRFSKPFPYLIGFLRLPYKWPLMVWLKQQRFIVSLFWRLQVQDQGAGRTSLPLKAWGKDLFQASFLMSGTSLPCEASQSSHDALPMCVSLSLYPNIPPFSKDTSYTEARISPPPVWLHLNQSTLQQPHFHIRPHSEVLGVKTITYTFGGGGDTIQPISLPVFLK